MSKNRWVGGIMAAVFKVRGRVISKGLGGGFSMAVKTVNLLQAKTCVNPVTNTGTSM